MAAKSKKRRKRNKKQTKKNTTAEFCQGRDHNLGHALAVGILMLISNFGIGGFVGEAVSDFVLFRIFGWIAFIMPIHAVWSELLL